MSLTVKPTPEEIAEALRLHKLHRNGDPEGKFANLGGANLGGAYLGRAYLGGAYLDGAYLDGAYLDGETVIETGETWGEYLAAVVPRTPRSGSRAMPRRPRSCGRASSSSSGCSMRG